jgi:hypothetical protein
MVLFLVIITFLHFKGIVLYRLIYIYMYNIKNQFTFDQVPNRKLLHESIKPIILCPIFILYPDRVKVQNVFSFINLVSLLQRN